MLLHPYSTSCTASRWNSISSSQNSSNSSLMMKNIEWKLKKKTLNCIALRARFTLHRININFMFLACIRRRRASNNNKVCTLTYLMRIPLPVFHIFSLLCALQRHNSTREREMWTSGGGPQQLWHATAVSQWSPLSHSSTFPTLLWIRS